MIILGDINKHTIRISKEQYRQLSEDVYVNGLNQKKKQATLTYNRNGRMNKNNLSTSDNVRTDKMNRNNGDTYEVPLKGGIMSYNITSINGMEVMHYFKRKFAKNGQKTELAFNDEEGHKELYELVMQDSELNQFINDFKAKVKAVVDSKISDFKSEDGGIPSAISIYPVPSSSNFNIEMAKILLATGFNGMKVQIINTDVLKKDTSNLQKDVDFIEKNKEYYSSPYSKDANYSHEDQMNTDINKLVAHSKALQGIIGDSDNKIMGLNDIFEKLIVAFRNRNKEGITPRQIERIGELYGEYVSIYNKILQNARYFSTIEKKEMGRLSNTLLKAIKYSKGPSIEARTKEIYHIAKKSNSFKSYNLKLTTPLDVCKWEPVSFQIKKLGNDVRMGLKNYYQPNKDEEMVKQEVDKAKNTVIIVFDDNISGGATLSDICLQLKNLGLDKIIPITFGEMHQQWRIGVTNILQPQNGFNMN